MTTFLYAKDKLGIGGPLLFPDWLSDGKKSHNLMLTRQERFIGLLWGPCISLLHCRRVTWHVSAEDHKGHHTFMKWSVIASQPDEDYGTEDSRMQIYNNNKYQDYNYISWGVICLITATGRIDGDAVNMTTGDWYGPRHRRQRPTWTASLTECQASKRLQDKKLELPVTVTSTFSRQVIW